MAHSKLNFYYLPVTLMLTCFFIHLTVRDLSTERYLGTLTDSQPGRVMCLACAPTSSTGITMVTGGTDLKVWMQVTDKTSAR